MTRDAERSHVKPIAHQMREKLHGGVRKMAKVCRALPRGPRHQHFGLVLPLNQTGSDKRGEGGGRGIDGTFRLLDRRQTERFGDACICMVNHSRPPALASSMYFYLTGLRATSKLD